MKGQLQNIISLCFVVIFFLMMIVPMAFGLFGDETVNNCEKRKLATFPKWEFSHEFLMDFNEWYEDHYGLRNELILIQAKIKFGWFKSSTNPKDCIIGKEGWLFYNSESDLMYGSYSRRNLLSRVELDFYVKQEKERKTILEEKGIKYLYFICPNKSTIYPEYLPYQMKMQIRDTVSKTDQIISHFAKFLPDLQMIDVRNAILSAKKKQLYRKLDSHWNDLGAYYAYKSFMEQTKDVFGDEPIELKDFDIVWKKSQQGDLLNMLGLCEQELTSEDIPIFTLKRKIEIINDDGPMPNSYGKRNPDAKNGMRVLFFRDSYGSAFIQFFSLHFKETYFVWTDYDQKTVDLIKPDVVVVSKVERRLFPSKE